MGLYKVEFRQSAGRDIRKITHSLIPNILRRIEALADNPFPRQSLELSGGEATYRLRIGDYRVVCEADTKTKTIIIHYIRHRREIYRKK